MRPMMWLALSMAACSGGKGGDGEASSLGVVGEGVSAAVDHETAQFTVMALPNIDDDDKNGKVDYGKVADDPDHAVITIEGTTAGVPQMFQLELEPGDKKMRIWANGQVVLDTKGKLLTAELPWTSNLELRGDFDDFSTDATLTVTETGTKAQTVVQLTTAPLILTHHLQPSELVVMVNMDFPGYANQEMVASYNELIPTLFTEIDGDTYPDPWIQDEIEIGYAMLPDGQRLDVVIDSIRDRELDAWPEEHLLGKDVGVKTWGKCPNDTGYGCANSLDSFGNLEVSPPIEGYPFGRIYYGASETASYYGMDFHPVDTDLFDDLTEGLQDPFTVDTSFLCVGHVDEFMTQIPDPTAPRGFRFVYTSIDLAWELLEAMDPETELPRYASETEGHGIATVGEMLEDEGLRNFNEDLKFDYLEPNLEVMKAELGLLDEEIVMIPGIFEECGGASVGLTPGMANMFVVNEPGGTRLLIPDPFVRTDLEDDSTDPFAEYVRSVLPSSAEINFIDDWIVYHIALGEVHCGTNGIRTPIANWWEE